MGKERRYLWKILLWAAVTVQIVMSTNMTHVTTMENQVKVIRDTSETGYAWSAWGRWSPCSRTCGGGIMYQERHCLPRDLTPANETIQPPIVTVRVSRQIRSTDCFGEDKRYRECNTELCPGGQISLRAEQCAVYDRKPFRGRFYTWVPYVDGDHPCLLNCRPLGQQFYATLSIVADGTPCTRPGVRAMCVGGLCKVVGREAVLAGSNTRELRCGRRLVSGLFSRPRLPLGYSYVATVPRGACRLNVSEITGSENYIALKILNGSFIMNGEFAVSSPGIYDAAGARFLYTQVAGRDQVFAAGPILQPIDIMILYTQPNPSIKYEYFTESLNGEVDLDLPRDAPVPNVPTKHSRRHHTLIDPHRPTASRYPDLTSMSQEADEILTENVVGKRKFTWKIISYSQCTRSCGGGTQIGKYRCVETKPSSPDREVAAVHCAGSPPAGRRRRCGNVPCPPRWRAAAWSTCPTCGPASRKRIVGCVMDHSKGITKISDQKCRSPRPHTTERCNIPNCEETTISNVRRIESKRVRPKEHTDAFRAGPIYTVTVNTSDINIGPEYSFSGAAGWLFTEWSECTGWCVGGGIQTRNVRCADPSGCSMWRVPSSTKSCTPTINCEPQDGAWFVGDWSQCSSKCKGMQVRSVLCIGGTGRHLQDSACKGTRPAHERVCGNECSPVWFVSDWGKCTGSCSGDATGLERRSVVCAHGDNSTNGEVSDADCPLPRPRESRTCKLHCEANDSPTASPPDDLVSESKNDTEYTITTTTQKVRTRESELKGCHEDKLSNCALVVQARLCHYKYYVENCCDSCVGR